MLERRRTLLTRMVSLDLVKSAEGHVGGAVVWNMKEGRVEQIKAKAIILSTGGAGRIFWTRTTNPFLSTGDGMAAAFRAGNGLKDMEMIQFHPTGLGRTGILMSKRFVVKVVTFLTLKANVS